MLYSYSLAIASGLLFSVTWALCIAYVFADLPTTQRVWGGFGVAVMFWIASTSLVLTLYYSIRDFRTIMDGRDSDFKKRT
jgi:hypothetical protein